MPSLDYRFNRTMEIQIEALFGERYRTHTQKCVSVSQEGIRMDYRPTEGISMAVVNHLRGLQLPRALELKAKVDHGQTLDDYEIRFLERLFAEWSDLKPFIKHRPEFQSFAVRIMSLYHAITAQALKNEQLQPPR